MIIFTVVLKKPWVENILLRKNSRIINLCLFFTKGKMFLTWNTRYKFELRFIEMNIGIFINFAIHHNKL